jgi:hypothetical protein
LRRQLESLSELGKIRLELRTDVRRRPERTACLFVRAGTDQDRIREPTQEAHDEAVSAARQADDASRFALSRQRDGSVDRGYEIGEDARLVDAERPAIGLRQARG